ncbi:hypothetical protein [Carnobacterium sp.]|uniref:hypothetical protein n=1 Tax=Carnobacterium sp. TaxID=48221 RepID=UPI0028A8B13E|nr:hypothetical protein [Carnobacterium sp.]
MIKRKKISRFLLIGFCGAILTSCSTNNNSTNDTTTTKSSEIDSGDTVSSESSSATSEMSSNMDNAETNSSGETTASSTDQENQETVDVASKLKIDPENILLPTDFPTADPSSVTADILINKSNSYTVSYTDDQGEIVEVSGTLYEGSEMAKQELTNFTDGIFIVEPKNENEKAKEELGTDLGHGITGYGEGSTGKSDFSWKEGNWQLSIHSRLEDQMKPAEIAKKIVGYLEDNTLPAPKDQGMIYIQYPQGGEEVDVDIRWQDEDNIYQLHTTRVPLEALEMTVSMQ